MSKLPYSLAVISALLIISGAACTSAAQAPSVAASIPQQPVGGGAAQPAPAVVPSETQTGGGASAPICKAATTCQVPSADQAEISCVKKIPYTNVSVPPGTSFEVLDKSGNFTCVDSGTVVNGKEVITCHGTQLYSFDLKLTSTACGGASLTTGGNQCQQGYGYDAAQKCCSPVSGSSSNSTTVSVTLGACPLPSP